MPQFDFDSHEYVPVMDAEQRAIKRKVFGWKDEWYVEEHNGKYSLVSRSHDDDIMLTISGNYTDEQRMRVLTEVCAQLNKAELDAAKEFDDTQPYVRSTNFIDPDGANMLRKVLPPGQPLEGERVHDNAASSKEP